MKPQWHTLKTLALCLEFDFDTKIQYFVRLGAIYPYVFSQMGRLVCKIPINGERKCQKTWCITKLVNFHPKPH